MTSNNPFAARLAQAAQEGYVQGNRRTFARSAAQPQHMLSLATDKQVAYINSLLTERALGDETRPAYRTRLNTLDADRTQVAMLDMTKASALIEYLQGLPVIPTTPAPAASAASSDNDVPAGLYAVEVWGTLGFFKVDRPVAGKWAGYTFVKRQLSTELVRISRDQKDVVLAAILAAGVKESAIRYGLELGICSRCNTELTNEESRAAGIGPVCRRKLGW